LVLEPAKKKKVNDPTLREQSHLRLAFLLE